MDAFIFFYIARMVFFSSYLGSSYIHTSEYDSWDIILVVYLVQVIFYETHFYGLLTTKIPPKVVKMRGMRWDWRGKSCQRNHIYGG